MNDLADVDFGQSDENVKLVGETKCENIPRRVCIPTNCGMVEAEEEQCINKQTLVVHEIPEEVKH